MKRVLVAVIVAAGLLCAALPQAMAELTVAGQCEAAKKLEKAGCDKDALAAYQVAITQTTDDLTRFQSMQGVIRIEIKLGDYSGAARTLVRAEIDNHDTSRADEVIQLKDLTPKQQKSLADAIESTIGNRSGLPHTRLLLVELLLLDLRLHP